MLWRRRMRLRLLWRRLRGRRRLMLLRHELLRCRSRLPLWRELCLSHLRRRLVLRRSLHLRPCRLGWCHGPGVAFLLLR